MNLKIIYTLYSNKKSSVFRNQNLINLLIIGMRLKIGEFFGSIYVKQKISSKNILDLTVVKNSIPKWKKLLTSMDIEEEDI